MVQIAGDRRSLHIFYGRELWLVSPSLKRSCGLTAGYGRQYSCVSIMLFPAVFIIL